MAAAMRTCVVRMRGRPRLLRVAGTATVSGTRAWGEKPQRGEGGKRRHKWSGNKQTDRSDLKPDNILLDGDGHVKLADFGLVAENMLKGQKTTDKTGTMYYMAPEVLADGEYDAAVDWLALGIIICEMLTGDHPYDTVLSSEEFRHTVIMRKPDYPDWVTTETKGMVSKVAQKEVKMIHMSF
ncbi:kinase C delta type-like [Pelobates cultripes]|uniref:Kinase C delta type-like n=1 Tax=Pelobates cultripes TaxID=61616 RepID=A0AAD1SU30_PELCU|nr:kinase C delta type-like [Pelobates cultripes]